MNPFHHALLANGVSATDLENLTLRMTSGVETVLTSISWFLPFETAANPRVVCDKKYFFLYGTDHASEADSGIMWGKGDKLDLTDFQEVALIVGGNYAETPYILNVPAEVCGDDELVHFFFHTRNEPGNTIAQETRLWTSSGRQELHLMKWIDRGRPITPRDNNNHTGYFFPNELEFGEYIGTHISLGGLPQPWENSTSTNARDWVRGEVIDVINGIDEGYFAQLSEGRYFKYYGIIWWLGQIHPESGGTTDNTRKLILAKADKISGAVTQQTILNYGDTNIRHSVKIDGNTAHIYITNPVSKMYHGTYDLRNLQKYI